MPALLFIAWRQLWDRKVLNGIAVCGVMLGVLPLIAISGILRGFQGKFVEVVLGSTPHVVLTVPATKDPATPPTESLRRALAAVRDTAGVTAASGSVSGTAVLMLGEKTAPVELRGVEPGPQDRVTPLRKNLIQGDFETFARSEETILLGAGVARTLGAAVGDELLGITIAGEKSKLKVAGIFETMVNAIDHSLALAPLRAVQALLQRPDALDRVEVRLDDPDLADTFAATAGPRHRLEARSWRQANANIFGLFDQQNVIIGFVLAALLAVGGFAILAIQVLIVMQKRRDIALLRSVGFRRRDVMAIVLLQGGIVALLGAVLGGVEGHFVLEKLRHTPVESGETFLHAATWIIWESPLQYALAGGFALVVGVAAAALPAWQASRVEPAEVLRGQT